MVTKALHLYRTAKLLAVLLVAHSGVESYAAVRVKPCKVLERRYKSEPKSPEAQALIGKLERKGFTREVAVQIVRFRPDIAQNIAKLGKALTLYRGLRIPPNGVDFTKSGGRSELNTSPGATSFSRNETEAFRYANKSGGKFKTIIAVELPESMFKLNGMTYSAGVVDMRQIQDLSPFVSHIGVVGRPAGAKNVETRWFTLGEAIDHGFFEPGFDYSPFFAE